MKTNTPVNTLESVQTLARKALPKDVVDKINDALKEEQPRGRLISILHKLQSHEGYLSTMQMDAVAQLLGVPTSEVCGVATFYHFFNLVKPGRFRISVCMGTACYVKGADKVLDRIQQELGISLGETTPDGMFSLAQARCLGTCGLAPIITVNETVYDRITADQIPAIIDKYVTEAHSSM